jgi:hypothetical protein
MKVARATTFRIAMLALVVLGGGWLVKNNWWPAGSSNMFVVTDGTRIQAVIVCTNEGEILWRIVATGKGREPKAIPYCEVPSGFKQEVPGQGAPRLFVKNEPLEVHVLSKTADMGDGGRATGPKEFLTLVNFSGYRTENTPYPNCRPIRFTP